jgi:urate oxidase
MTIRLGDNQYGKAETHVVRVTRGAMHDVKDMTVSIALAGDFSATHLTGDNSHVVPTDTQKNTVFAFAKDPVGEIEDFALRLGRHFVSAHGAVRRARVSIVEQPWERITVGGKAHPHAFARNGSEVRLAMVTCTEHSARVVSGITGLILLKSTGSEFWGYRENHYTTLPETRDRMLATAVEARWRYGGESAGWMEARREARRLLIETFASKHSLSLQQTLYAMGEAVLEARADIAEIRLTMANKHHFVVDLEPFGLNNENEVFYASDRPYGLIEGTVTRDDASPADDAW